MLQDGFHYNLHNRMDGHIHHVLPCRSYYKFVFHPLTSFENCHLHGQIFDSKSISLEKEHKALFQDVAKQLLIQVATFINQKLIYMLEEVLVFYQCFSLLG